VVKPLGERLNEKTKEKREGKVKASNKIQNFMRIH